MRRFEIGDKVLRKSQTARGKDQKGVVTAVEVYPTYTVVRVKHRTTGLERWWYSEYVTLTE